MAAPVARRVASPVALTVASTAELVVGKWVAQMAVLREEKMVELMVVQMEALLVEPMAGKKVARWEVARAVMRVGGKAA